MNATKKRQPRTRKRTGPIITRILCERCHAAASVQSWLVTYHGQSIRVCDECVKLADGTI